MKTMRSEIVRHLEGEGFKIHPEFNGMLITFMQTGVPFLLDLRMGDRYMLSCEIIRPKDLEEKAFIKAVDRTNLKAKGLNVHYDKVRDVAVITSAQFSSCMNEFISHFMDCLGVVSNTASVLKEEIAVEQLPF